METRRKITITTRGPIAHKSGVVGPITVPYLEKVSLISRMIIGGITVVEHMENGETQVLSTEHLKELNTNARIIKENRLQVAERGRIAQMAKDEQDKLISSREASLKEAKAQVEASKQTVEKVEELTQAQSSETLSKKERKEQARIQAEQARVQAELLAKANEQQEDSVETK